MNESEPEKLVKIYTKLEARYREILQIAQRLGIKLENTNIDFTEAKKKVIEFKSKQKKTKGGKKNAKK